MSLKISVAPVTEPVSLDEAKLHLRVDLTDEDTLIDTLIAAAREDCEKFQNRAYISQTWELWLDAFPSRNYIELPLPPFQCPVVTAGSFVTGTVYRIVSLGTTNFTLIGASANTVGVVFTATGAGEGTGTATASGIVKYYGTDDTEYSISGADLIFDVKSEPGRIVLGYGSVWPSTTLRPANGVCITFIAGYGAAELVPSNVKQAILLMTGHLYENRVAIVSSGAVPHILPLGVEALLWKDRVVPL